MPSTTPTQYLFTLTGLSLSTGLGLRQSSLTLLSASLCLPLTSIYTAELYAIYLALQCILNLPESSFTIFSDSQSALAGLGTLYSSHPLLLRIHSFLMDLHTQKKSITFC